MSRRKPAGGVPAAYQEYGIAAVGELRPHPDNPRRGDVEAIGASIAANGFYGTIVVQKGTGHILAGNHRWRAAVEAGIASVPVVWLDVDDDRARRILLADNRANDRAGYDFEELARILGELDAADGGLEGTGWDGDDLTALLAELAPEPKADEAPDPGPADLPGSLTWRPGWNAKRTCRFLSLRKWHPRLKRRQTVELRRRKDAGDPALEDVAAAELAEALRAGFGDLGRATATSPPPGRSSAGGHFAANVARKVAGHLGAAHADLFAPSPKRTRGVSSCLDDKRRAPRTPAPAGAVVVLVDDVAATGTTVEACAAALAAEGALVIPVVWIYGEAEDAEGADEEPEG